MISLNLQTQRLIEQKLKESGLKTPDELVQLALNTLDTASPQDLSDLDPTVLASIEEGFAQAEKDETLPWEKAREDLRARFIERR
jgi:hypothetical protein